MNKRTNWETYVYVPSRETLERRYDDCIYEINWIWTEQFRNQDLRFNDELPGIWKRLDNAKNLLKEHYDVEVSWSITTKNRKRKSR